VGRIVLNPEGLDAGGDDARPAGSEAAQATAFHRRLPGYAPTPLRELPDLAAELGLRELWLKDESDRFGLPAFKILGASWATARTLWERLGLGSGGAGGEALAAAGLRPIRERLAERAGREGAPLELVSATDGNHGRGVARVAAWLDCRASIFMPAGTVPARIEAIAAEGAVVTVVDADYDGTVRRAAAHAEAVGGLLIQDTSWPGYEEVPRRVIEGYATLITEIREALDAAGRAMPDLAVVPIGVGSLAAAVGAHPDAPERLVGVEPVSAACALESVEAGASRSASGRGGATIMAGLDCGTLATLAWPVIRGRYAALAAVDDDRAADGMRRLGRRGLVAGESGAASLAGLIELVESSAPDAAAVRARLGIGPDTRALVLMTEGATDPESYRRLVG
jgi:diaminopropionate ammonia-lyase